jgi:colicin import membrane protein
LPVALVKCFHQVEREARVKEAIAKLEKETRDRQSEEAQKAREIEDLKKEKREREKAEREAMEEVKKLRKERADREKRERAQKDEIQKLKNDKGAALRVLCYLLRSRRCDPMFFRFR